MIYLQVHEWTQAIDSAKLAIQSNPLWWEAHQTLGRAYMGCGEVNLARKAFSRAVHIKPDDQELRNEDLIWCQGLYNHQLQEEEAKKLMSGEEKTQNGEVN